MRYCDIENRYKGALTLEMMLVFPILFFVIIVLLDYNLYCHDRSKILATLHDTTQMVAYDLSHEVLLTGWNQNSCETKGSEYLYRQLEQGCFITKLIDVNIEINADTLRIRGSYQMDLPGLFLPIANEKKHFVAFFEQEQTLSGREERTRMYYAAVKLGKKIDGVQEIIGKINDLYQKIH